MSETNTHIGRLVKVDLLGMTVQEFCKLQLKKNGYEVEEKENVDYFEQWKEDLSWEDKYVIYNDDVYKVEDEQHDYEDICEARFNTDGSISYVLQFYNGGTCFTEMIYDALEKIYK